MGRTGRIYRKIRSSFVDRPTFFTWVDEGSLSASGLPSSEKQVAWLARSGVKTILTLTEAPLPKEWLERNGIKGVHVSMNDHQGPDVNKLKEAVAMIKSELKSGRPVHVHCLAGKGRTGTVLAVFLTESRGLSMKEAVQYLRRVRPGSVESPQEMFLQQYQKDLEKFREGRK
jgi:atypical dual specificity phosphatase